MSTYEASYKSLLQGVSQQLPEERLPGQLTSQVNMVSDPVTNLRRRPGVLFRKSWAWASADYEHSLGWFTDIAGSRVHILLNTNTGNIRILNENFVEEASLNAGAYLINADPTHIRATSVGNEFFLCNVDKSPVVQYGTTDPNPANSGFFYIVSGAFSKGYNVNIVHGDGALTATYTTPSGTGSGDAALATPEYIAEQLYNQLAGNSFSDVRITGVNGTGTGYVYDFQLQENIGSSITPNWVNRTAPFEMTAARIANGFLRFRYESEDGEAVSFNFQVKVGGTWKSTVYTSSSIALYWTDYGQPAYETVPLTLFTSQVTLSGDPTLFVQRDGPYVFVSRAGGISVNTSVGSGFMVASKSGVVPSTGGLPARLPSAANGFICRVGTGDSPQYYRYNHLTTEWSETGAWGSPNSITNVPISILWNGTAWALNTKAFDGRNAGDDDSNELHEWMTYGITGMGTYQGRLVLMSGPLVSLSASNKPRQFFRSTVSSLLNSDAIEVGAGMNSAAAYEWAIPFQKDLVLFSRTYQAVIPSGNSAITPATATVVPTSAHETDTTSSPITLGRTLMYCTSKSEDFFGAMEMIPSNYTDSQYVSQDSTPHLPKYMGGRCRFAVSSGVASLALFSPSGDPYSLVVHEYHWDGDSKVQQAWHQWTFEYPIAYAYFASDVVVLAFIQNGNIVLGTVDPRAGALNASSERRPFLDLNVSASIVDNTVTIPAWMLAFDPAIRAKLKLVMVTGALAGEEVGFTNGATANTLTTALSHPSGTVGIGIPYYSGVIPSPPVVKDYNDQTIHSGKATLQRYMVGTKNSSEFTVNVTDAYSTGEDLAVPTLSWSSPELELGRGLYADTSISIVPCRTDLRSTAMEVSTEGTGELNITSLEYVAKYHPKIKRR
ncbi:tail tubular B [Sphaerotilus phage vB_SnaP-R1]|uniref:Tail tubular B n=1 Tax=Sphaerotilus phage vB_SnaP-R1 TaxID=2696336 RepID=A0A6B9SY76_9CAUD|nr:tail tubular B [Sphaerotilus phage vB_SnaP-R1]